MNSGKQGCAWAAVGAADVSTMISRAKSKVFVRFGRFSGHATGRDLEKMPLMGEGLAPLSKGPATREGDGR
jgi:hypothetical protein